MTDWPSVADRRPWPALSRSLVHSVTSATVFLLIPLWLFLLVKQIYASSATDLNWDSLWLWYFTSNFCFKNPFQVHLFIYSWIFMSFCSVIPFSWSACKGLVPPPPRRVGGRPHITNTESFQSSSGDCQEQTPVKWQQGTQTEVLGLCWALNQGCKCCSVTYSQDHRLISGLSRYPEAHCLRLVEFAIFAPFVCTNLRILVITEAQHFWFITFDNTATSVV